jgi:hypothetical protein
VSSLGSIGSVQQVAPVDPRGNRRDGAARESGREGEVGHRAADRGKASGSSFRGEGSATSGTKALTRAEQSQVKELAQIDQQVRAHESAHQAAAGSLGGAVSFSYETGPDGKSYAVGGEVPVDLSSGRTPEETIARAQQVRAAALAPADPSPQDLSVAAAASQMEATARAQLAQQQREQLAGQQGSADAMVPVAGEAQAGGRDAASISSSSSERPSANRTAATDVSAQAAATLSALQADRASTPASQAQAQYLARLAAAAYRM